MYETDAGLNRDPNFHVRVDLLNRIWDTVRQFADSHLLRWASVFDGFIAAGRR